MYIFNPTLKSLKQKLNIEPINTGKLLTYRHIVFDDIERLHAFIGLNGCVHFKSGMEFSSIQYRGQNEDYGVCKTTLDRLDSKEKQFLSICQTIAFEELLEIYPFIKFTRSIKFMNNPVNINLTGISQHYGLHTNYLDITSNFDVASFFATCKYEKGKYYPIVNILKVNKDIDIGKDIKKYYFKHSISQSRRIWKQFDEGKTLFPKDSASDLANECKKLNAFTQNQIDKAFDRFELWSGNKISNNEQILDYLKIIIIDNNGLSWDDLVETKQEYWENKFNETLEKVGVRLTI